MKPDFEKVKEARDSFIALYQPKVEDLMSHFSAGIGKSAGKIAIVALCAFENLDNLPDETKTKIESILPKTFKYGDVEYPIKIQYISAPVAQ